MATWPTVSDLADYLNQDIEVGDPTAVLFLDLAKSAVQAEIGQLIDVATAEVITLDGNGKPLLMLPQLPVTSITSIVVDGTTLTAGIDYDWNAAGLLYRLAGDWGTKPRSIIVTYTHGSADVPELAHLVALQAAARGFASLNPSNVLAETIGNYSVTYASGSGNSDPETRLTLTDEERRMLSRISIDTGLA
jgi:hypothetical protein